MRSNYHCMHMISWVLWVLKAKFLYFMFEFHEYRSIYNAHMQWLGFTKKNKKNNFKYRATI